MENTKYGKRREGRWTPIRAKAQDTRANPNSWETHLVRKRWDSGLLRALSPRIMMMMMMTRDTYYAHTETTFIELGILKFININIYLVCYLILFTDFAIISSPRTSTLSS